MLAVGVRVYVCTCVMSVCRVPACVLSTTCVLAHIYFYNYTLFFILLRVSVSVWVRAHAYCIL